MQQRGSTSLLCLGLMVSLLFAVQACGRNGALVCTERSVASLEGEEQAQLEEVYCRSTRMRDDNAKRWPESKDPAEAEVYQQQARACADVRANARSVLERKYGLVGDLECCEEFKLCAPEAPTPQEQEGE